MGRKRKKKDPLPPIIVDTRAASSETKRKIHDTVVDTNHAAHSILDIADETLGVAKKTDGIVHEQGEQIDQIVDAVTDLHLDVKQSEKKVDGIRSIWHRFVNWITPKCLQPEKTEIDQSVDEIRTTQDRAPKVDPANDAGGASVTFLFDEKTQRVEDDTFSTLATASDVLAEMNSTARRTNKELRRQNKVLDQVQEEAEGTEGKLKRTNKKATDFLKK